MVYATPNLNIIGIEWEAALELNCLNDEQDIFSFRSNDIQCPSKLEKSERNRKDYTAQRMKVLHW